MSTDNVTMNKPLISVRGLEKKFANGQVHALKGVDADIYKGEAVVIIGPSGSGKSTFLRCLNLLDRPTGGQVIFEGTDITSPKVNINQHRMRMGMVFQHFNLFPHMSILRNLTIAPMKLKGVSREEAEEEALKLLEPAFRRTEAACGHSARAGDAPGRDAV